MQTQQVEGVELVLSHPDELEVAWVGQGFVQEQLLAAWLKVTPRDLALSPRILGHPGVGKTSLAYATGRALGREVYIVQATMDTRPEDLLVTPVMAEQGRLRYHASGLVTAMLRGGVCVLDEGNRMTEKSWASLAPLLDTRRYVESVVAGIKIHAHPDFLFCATMNEDASTFEIPEYIQSRLQPRIVLDFPERDEELAIMRENLPHAEADMLEYLASFLQRAHRSDERYTVRDGINIGRYAMKILRAQEAGTMGPLPGREPRPSTQDQRLRAVSRSQGFDLDTWFKSALEGVLTRGEGEAGAPAAAPAPSGSSAAPPPGAPGKGPAATRGGAAAPAAPPRPPPTPLQAALRHAAVLVLGDECLAYMPDEPGPHEPLP